MDLKNLSIASVRQSLVDKVFSAKELTEYFLAQINEKDSDLKAFLSVNKEEALKQAVVVDEIVTSGRELPSLSGLPLAVKDNILIEDWPATAASKILENYRGAYDATIIKKLREAGVVFLGKTNLDEFAMGSSTENSGFQTTHNPFDLERVPGGSSGGSAAAVAGGLALAGLGSDTGGSIRQPAAFCGIVGLKPTYGAVSRFGLMALASSLDQIGPMTISVADAYEIFKVLAGRDSFDTTTVDIEKEYPLAGILEQPERFKKLKIGLPKEYFEGLSDPAVAQGMAAAIEKLKKIGCSFKEISLPHTQYALSVYYIIMPAEASANLGRFDGIRYSRLSSVDSTKLNLKEIYFKQRGEGFGREVKRRILLGTFVLSYGYYDAYYLKAQKVRRLIKEDFDKAFDPSGDGVDVILSPVTPTPAFKIGEKAADPLSMYLSDIFTIPANLAGVPALSLPIKKYELGGGELPVNFQLIGKPFHEADLLGLGNLYERF
ncbi:MAG: Asp-tRNA(Asn)/Glu-tRNA(Gln) amidotransferase subunit GatA [bacterium]|nr:Asp-tRNA(Asn)/Glu-tRNA(Gln) amidotransferase subunit GatA [bacterium]